MRPIGKAVATAAVFLCAQTARTQTENVLGGMRWRELGPAVVGGRIDDIAVVESNPDVIYVGTASGGLWKSVDGALTWKPIFDRQGAMSIGAVAIAPSDPSIIWLGTGEPNNRQSSSWGDGVYKSTDAGQTWTNVGLRDTQHIGRVVIDPRNSNVVYVAALGHLWGANEERGLYKTVDGGKTWSRILYINPDTGVVDVKLDPESTDTLYAAAYQRRRTPFGFNGGGPNSALFKSTDGGATWKKLENGLPYGDGSDTGRIGVAIYRKNPRIVYAEVQHVNGGLYRSDDRGETWRKMSSADPNPPYFSNVYIDPNNDLRIWIAALQGSGEMSGVAYSQDGGKSFAPTWGTRVHPDFHAMWIDPANSDHLLIGVDGGLYTTRDGGLAWEHLNQIPIGQAYQVGYDMARPYHVCAGFQDNGSVCGPTMTRNVAGIMNTDWLEVLGGDGFHSQPDAADPNLVYVESQEGSLLRLNVATHEWANIVPQPKTGEAPYRFEWNAPIIISSHDPKTIYFGAQFLFKSTDRGDSWKTISPDLTTGVDRNTIPIFGKLPKDHILSRNYGVTWYPCITRISESPMDATVLWVGTQDGNLQVTRDAGKTWQNVSGRVPNVPKGLYVNAIEPSRLGPGAAYVVFDGHRSNDFGIYIYLTTDYGQTWKSIAGNLPSSTGSARVIREDPKSHDLLFLGTEFGAYVSFDRGEHWTELGNDLPKVRVDDIKIHPRDHDLILATHGRALWVLDDIAALEESRDENANMDLYLFDLRPAISWRKFDVTSGVEGQKPFIASNPAYGALITYSLKQALKDKEKAVVTILDKDNKVVREFNGTGAAGINRINWDLRYSTPLEPTAEQKWAIAEGFFYRVVEGPVVEPGDYRVRITVGKNQATKMLHVEDDPSVTISEHDRATRSEAMMRAYDLYKTGMEGQRKFRAVKTALTSTLNSWKGDNAPQIPENLRKETEAYNKKLDEIGPLFVGRTDFADPPVNYVPPPVPERVAHVLFILEGYTAAPRGRDLEQLNELIGIQRDALNRLNEVVNVDLKKLNKSFVDAGVPHIAVAEKLPAAQE